MYSSTIGCTPCQCGDILACYMELISGSVPGMPLHYLALHLTLQMLLAVFFVCSVTGLFLLIGRALRKWAGRWSEVWKGW